MRRSHPRIGGDQLGSSREKASRVTPRLAQKDGR
jgi:hypothetical protein